MQGFYLVTEKSLRKTRAGDSYLDMTLSDKTGKISAKMWKGFEKAAEEFEQGDAVVVKAHTDVYRNRMQLNVSKISKVREEHEEYGFSLDSLVPSSERDSKEMWTEVMELIDSVEDKFLKKILEVIYEENEKRIQNYPAAKFIHHNFRGGLLEHTLSLAIDSIYFSKKFPYLNRDLLLTGALLHDIGKLFVPSELLNTPRKLTTNELSVLKTHVDLGRDYLEKVDQLDPVAMAIVAEHHERLDGSGYPKKLKGDDISIYGRMAAVVDVYEAMTSVRPYRQSTFSFDEVLMLLEETNATQYDMRVVEEFREMIEKNLLQVEVTDQNLLATDKFIAKQYIKRMKRFYFRMPMDIQEVDRVGDQFVLGPSERMIVHNISCSGIGFISPHPFAVDQNIYISIPCLENLEAVPFAAGVVHCRKHKDGWYTMGAKFH
ncbi:MAG: HD domain-containing protein, partial [Planctomycetes bacterium]|nr:HD domain-containing protein [Planctomycetota bacterium]